MPDNPTPDADPGAYGVLTTPEDDTATRPRRRPLRVLLAVTLVLLVTVPSTLWLKHVGDVRSADRAALAAVVLDIADKDAPFEFRNTSPTAVTVVSARIDRAGYHSTEIGNPLAAGATLAIPLSFDAPCPTVLPRSGPSGVLITVRTRGGDRVVRVDIRDSATSYSLLEDIRSTCQLLWPHEVIDITSAILELQGHTLVAKLELTNRSVLRNSLTALSTMPGLHISTTPTLPLALPAARPGLRGGAVVALTVRVTVSGCALTSWLPRPPGGLDAVVSGTSAAGPAYLQLGEYAQSLSELVPKVCGEGAAEGGVA